MTVCVPALLIQTGRITHVHDVLPKERENVLLQLANITSSAGAGCIQRT